MLLENRNAIVYGAGGSVGGAVTRAFAGAGARVFLAGRTLAPLEAVADEITAAGGHAEVAQVDALDRDAVDAHVATVAEAGGIDVSFNAIWIRGASRASHCSRCRSRTSRRRSTSLLERTS